MARPEKIRLGDLLIQQELITREQLQFALDEQKRNGRKLGRVLADNHFISEEQISESLAKQLDIPYINLKNYTLNLELVRRLPENQARRFRALPLEEHKDGLLVGMADPTDTLALDELGETLKRKITVAVATEGQLLETIDRAYRRTEEISGLARELSEKSDKRAVDFGDLIGATGVEEMPVVNLLQALFGDAIQAKASAIHLDFQAERMQTRFRMDGRLQLQAEADHKIAAALLSRLKQMSGLDNVERHAPQEGGFNIQVRKRAMDVRISTLPAQHGESMLVRLLNQDEAPASLDKLDMPPEMLIRLREIIRRGSGMVLVSDPAGSGAIATLYAVLMEIKSAERKIVTVEDPVEYGLSGITQVQIDENAGLTFARALHSALRQDPDVILLGELRDPEAAQLALRAALDGCLVLSTMHECDAAATLSRLAGMGIPQSMIAASVQVVLAQRMLRRICASCSEPHTPGAQEAAWLKQAEVSPESLGKLMRGRGCAKCNGSGYNGRIAVYEILEPAAGNAGHAQMKGRTLLDRALAQMGQGQTTVAEVMRIGDHAQK